MNKIEKKAIIKEIKNSIDFNLLANWCNATTGQLSDVNDRHIASELRDRLFEMASEGKIKYKNGPFSDLHHYGLDITLEVKYLSSGFLYTKTKNQKPYANVVLKNTNSKNTIIDYDFESKLVICCEPHCFSALFIDDLKKFNLIDYSSKPGQIVAKKVPRNLFYKITDYKNFNIIVENYPIQQSLDNFKKITGDSFYNHYKEALTKNAHKNKIKIKNKKPNKESLFMSYSEDFYKIISEKSLDVKDAQKEFYKIKNIEIKEERCRDILNRLCEKGKITKTEVSYYIKGNPQKRHKYIYHPIDVQINVQKQLFDNDSSTINKNKSEKICNIQKQLFDNNLNNSKNELSLHRELSLREELLRKLDKSDMSREEKLLSLKVILGN